MTFANVRPIKFGAQTKAFKLESPAVGNRGIEHVLVSARGMNVLSQRAFVRQTRRELLLTRERPEDMLECTEALPINQFSQGFAALLSPFANRLPGRPLGNGSQEVMWGNAVRRIPVNFPQEGLAIHGLVYDSAYENIDSGINGNSAYVKGTVHIPDELWFSPLKIDVATELSGGVRSRTVEIENIGDECAPVGTGEHPDFKIPKGQPREEVRLRIPARFIVRSGADMLPDFKYGSPIIDVRDSELKGLFVDDVKERKLGGLILDHCFTGLDTAGNLGEISMMIEYPKLRWGIKISAFATGAVNAIQVYSPTDPSLPAYGSIAVEFQTNFADPFNPMWANYSPLSYVPNRTMPSGMHILAPGEKMTWGVRHSVYSW